jgi:hypothetical protein
MSEPTDKKDPSHEKTFKELRKEIKDLAKSLYRRQSMKYHPDRTGGDKELEKKFKEAVKYHASLHWVNFETDTVVLNHELKKIRKKMEELDREEASDAQKAAEAAAQTAKNQDQNNAADQEKLAKDLAEAFEDQQEVQLKTENDYEKKYQEYGDATAAAYDAEKKPAQGKAEQEKLEKDLAQAFQEEQANEQTAEGNYEEKYQEHYGSAEQPPVGKDKMGDWDNEKKVITPEELRERENRRKREAGVEKIKSTGEVVAKKGARGLIFSARAGLAITGDTAWHGVKAAWYWLKSNVMGKRTGFWDVYEIASGKNKKENK